MNESTSNRIRYTGFFMTVFMVCYHCPTFELAEPWGHLDSTLTFLVSYVFNTMGVLVMSWFFMITGFLLFNNLNFSNYCVKIKKRVFSLLIPYLAWQCLIAVKLLVQKKEEFSLLDFLRRIVAFEVWPFDGALWYVYAVFILAVFSPILLLLFKNKYLGGGFVLVSSVLLQYVIDRRLFSSITDYGYIGNICSYFPSYLIGAFYGRFSKQFTTSDSLIYAFFMIFVAFLLEGWLPGFTYKILVRMMPLGILYLIPEIPKLKDKSIYKLSFLIYAVHQPLIADLWPIIQNVYLHISLPTILYTIFTRVIVLFFAVLIALVIRLPLKKYAPGILNILTGGRN